MREYAVQLYESPKLSIAIPVRTSVAGGSCTRRSVLLNVSQGLLSFVFLRSPGSLVFCLVLRSEPVECSRSVLSQRYPCIPKNDLYLQRLRCAFTTKVGGHLLTLDDTLGTHEVAGHLDTCRKIANLGHVMSELCRHSEMQYCSYLVGGSGWNEHSIPQTLLSRIRPDSFCAKLV